MALFGDLVATMVGRELSGLRTQVYQSMVPLLLHLKDKCPKVAMVSAHRGKTGRQPPPGPGTGRADGSRAA